jgi:hypothetical protein
MQRILFIIFLLVALVQSNSVLFKENQLYFKASLVRPTQLLSPYFEVPMMLGMGAKSKYWKNTYIDFSLSGTQAKGIVGEGDFQKEVSIAWLVGETGFGVDFSYLLDFSFKGGLSLHFVKGEESALLLSSNESDFGYFLGFELTAFKLNSFRIQPFYELLQAWTLPERSYFHVLGIQCSMEL